MAEIQTSAAKRTITIEELDDGTSVVTVAMRGDENVVATSCRSSAHVLGELERVGLGSATRPCAKCGEDPGDQGYYHLRTCPDAPRSRLIPSGDVGVATDILVRVRENGKAVLYVDGRIVTRPHRLSCMPLLVEYDTPREAFQDLLERMDRGTSQAAAIRAIAHEARS